MTESEADQAFLSALRASSAGWIALEDYKKLFEGAVSVSSDDVDFGKRRMRACIDRLAAAGLVKPTSGRKSQIPCGPIMVPSHLKYVKVKQPQPERQFQREWDAKLAGMVRGSSPARLQVLEMIDIWLKNTASSSPPLVPVNTRSLHIFGDEKKLLSLCRPPDSGELSKTLNLEHLRCYIPMESYLPCEVLADARLKEILVIENAQTYHSMKLRNRRERSYCAVAYSGGANLSKTVPAIIDLANECGAKTVRYFGDIDIPGFDIPMNAIKNVAFLHSDLRFEPAAHLYDELLRIGKPNSASYEHPDRMERLWTSKVAGFVDSWLEAETAEKISVLLSGGFRLAQEWVV